MAPNLCGHRPHLLFITDQPADLGGSDPARPNRAARRERDRRLTSIDGAAEYFRVSSATISRWIGVGRVTAYRLGRGYVVDLDEIEAGMRSDPYAMRDGRRKRFGPNARIVTVSLGSGTVSHSDVPADVDALDVATAKAADEGVE